MGPARPLRGDRWDSGDGVRALGGLHACCRLTAAKPGRSNRTRYVDINGLAEYLGVTVRHIRRLVAEERIPYIKWGLNLHFDLDEIDVWIDQHRRPVRQSS